MQDFTQNKLINNLIDIVAHFYRLREEGQSAAKTAHLKGFSEGIAFALVEQGVLTRIEAERILANEGEKRPLPQERPQRHQSVRDPLDIPTIFRKKEQCSDRK